MREVAPGIFRIESVLGPRPFSQYLVRGAERALLVDSGILETPRDHILPALAEAGVEPDYVLLSHADCDHFGGSAALRAAFPRALFLAHAADVAWIEDKPRIMRERYGWYEAYGIPYPPDTFRWLGDQIGPEVPVDVALRGDEELRLGPDLRVRVLALPGHTAGHVGLWEPASRTAIVQDAVMASGLLDTEGTVIHPPPVPLVAAYERSTRLLQELRPERLLTAHYDVIEGADVQRFLGETLAFVERARAVVREELADGPLPLSTLLERANPRLGPFTSMPNELALTLRAIADESGLTVTT